ncbi:MAG: PhoU domain-containing protein [Candidatus Methanomethylophilaceae archaeon]|jgi:phosphate uptake regulator
MDVRKIQQTGGSSYIVTLPKDWIVKTGLKKNDSVNIQAQKDGSLILTSVNSAVPIGRSEKKICVDDISDCIFLFRILVGAYMSGYSTVRIYSSEKFSSSVTDTIRNFVQIAIGLEILEEDENVIIVRDLVDPSEMKLSRGVERMKVLVKNMLTETFSSIQSSDVSRAKAVIERDREVDRLEWLITRQTNMFNQDISVARRMGHTPAEVTNLYTIARIIERMGDHAVILAKNCSAIMEKGPFDNSMRMEMLTLGDRITKLYGRALETFVKKDLDEANDCIEETLKVVDLCRQMNRYAVGMPADTIVSINMIVSSMRRICEYSIDISELAINSLMGE